MKLASTRAGRDGQLLVVSQDLSRAVAVPEIAPTLQSALDRWDETSPALSATYDRLNRGEVGDALSFDPHHCAAPLPRAYQWADCSAYVNHVELVRKARGAAMPESFWHDPLVYQGGSDRFLGPCDPIELAAADWGLDFEGELAVITDDVPMGTTPEDALQHVCLVMLVNDVSLRELIPGELAKGFGFYQSKPASSASPVAVTPDELGASWRGGKIHLPLVSHLNGRLFGNPNAGVDMTFSFAELIAHITKTRSLGTGSIVGGGTVSNKQGTEHGTAVSDGGVGYSCIAELRMIETIRHGTPATPFLRPGDNVRLEMLDTAGASVFGAIDQTVVADTSGPTTPG